MHWLGLPSTIGRALGRARDHTIDVCRFVRGLALRDAPRRHTLFTAPTATRPMRLMLTRPGHIEDELERSGNWEPHVARAIAFFMRAGGTFVDVGANIGYHALWVALSRPDARVVCFEPNPSVRDELVRNVALNELATVDVRPYALGDGERTVALYAHTGRAYNRGSSSMNDVALPGERAERIEVEMRTLDRALPAELRVDVVKIDTEGYEAAVLRGARELIARCRPVIVLELEARLVADPVATLREIRALLPRYQLWKLERAELVPLDPGEVEGRLFRADLIALPRDATPS
ncbi:MAG TPA: FkbM family methyltransferase [Kofleriaceae bacterium]|nr:FkbM family methyltransferase [Kofleriaceae bacterium]